MPVPFSFPSSRAERVVNCKRAAFLRRALKAVIYFHLVRFDYITKVSPSTNHVYPLRESGQGCFD